MNTNLRCMRYLAWIAIFSLQLGIFVCEAGVDVCHVADTSSQIQLSPTQSDNEHKSAPIDTCSAHAAHVFLSPVALNHNEPNNTVESVGLLVSLNLPEILRLIEQPPKRLHS